MRARRCLWLAPALLLAGGCDTPQNYMIDTGGSAASMLAQLGWKGLIAFSAAALVTFALILWVALRRRGSLAEHEPIDVNRGQSWILVGGFGIPFAVLVFLFVSTIDTLSAFPMAAGPGSNSSDRHPERACAPPIACAASNAAR